MSAGLRVVSWNCRRASRKSALWTYLLDLDPDVALLQEVGEIPRAVLQRFTCDVQPAMGKLGTPQKFDTAILVRGWVGPPIPMVGPSAWVDAELRHFAGNIIARKVWPERGRPLKLVSIYSPAWPVDRTRLEGLDLSDVKLKLNRHVWVADLLWASLVCAAPATDDHWIVGGDFNSSETFDRWPGGPPGNGEYLSRMAALGLTECLRTARGELTPTFRNPRGGAIKHQLDHIFVTGALAARLRDCETGSHEQVFMGGLSDHLPIIAMFDMEVSTAEHPRLAS